MAPDNERKECLICDGPGKFELYSTGEAPVAVGVQCPHCGHYAVSYSLWHRMKLSGWNGMIMRVVRQTLMDDTVRGARLQSGKPPLLVSFTDADEDPLHLETHGRWLSFLVEE